MKRLMWALLWLGVYLCLLAAPLVALTAIRETGGGGFAWDLAMALGFGSAALLGLMFLLAGRFHRADLPFGIDIVYYFHGQLAWVTLLVVTGHAVLALAAAPGMLRYFAAESVPRYLASGVVSAALLMLLVLSSVLRKKIGLEYDHWRFWHAVLAVACVATGALHMFGADLSLHHAPLRALWALIFLCVLAILGYVRCVRPLLMVRHPFAVEEVREERGSSWTVVVRPSGHGGFAFLPGQFAWLTARSSPFAWKEHPFSISSSAEQAGRLSFTIKELGDFTSQVGDLVPGEQIYLDGPYGAFSVDRQDAPGYVFIAGGIGIAPIVGMLRTLADRGDRRPLLLLYGCGTWDRVVLREEIEALRETLNLTVVFVLEDPPPDWTGETGFVTEELLGRYLPDYRSGREYFLCGPTAMKESVERALYRQRVPLERIHSELYDLV